MTKRLLFFTLTCILLASCQSYKKVPYLQDPGEAQRAVAEAKLYDARILPKDLLTIEPPADGDWGKVWASMESGSEQAGKSDQAKRVGHGILGVRLIWMVHHTPSVAA